MDSCRRRISLRSTSPTRLANRPRAVDVEAFVEKHPELVGTLEIPGIAEPFTTTAEQVTAVADKFLSAVKLAGRIYRHIVAAKGVGNFVTEVSMDETDRPQTPPELLIILAMLADEQIPLQTIAPKFTGRFNKGVDYVGDVAQFEREFNDDLAVIAHAVQAIRLAERSEAERPLGQRQVLDLRSDQAGTQAHRGRVAHQDRRHELARRGHRAGRSWRRGLGTRQGSLHQSTRKARGPLRPLRERHRRRSSEAAERRDGGQVVERGLTSRHCGTIRRIRSSMPTCGS